jgi:tRNA threonylcarbamoyladenosine biosynthesis protein TsaB
VKILTVDTALGACSVALTDGARVLAHRFVLMERGHAEALAPMVEDAMREASVAFSALDRLVVTTGPGTFTGQRVGLAFMRGLRIALGKPLIGVTTLAVMAEQAREETRTACAIALHDARRGEVYIEIADILAPSVLSFAEALDAVAALPPGPIALAGTAAPLMAEALALRRAGLVLSSVRQPDALYAARLGAHAVAQDAPPRPLYLRAPDAKLPAPAS